jgi:hypothetical protein
VAYGPPVYVDPGPAIAGAIIGGIIGCGPAVWLSSEVVSMIKITLAIAFAISAAAALAEPLPYPKGSAQCSGSYMQSGSYCIPKSERSAAAIPKPPGAQCPAG